MYKRALLDSILMRNFKFASLMSPNSQEELIEKSFKINHYRDIFFNWNKLALIRLA